jgi:hypothetical protein
VRSPRVAGLAIERSIGLVIPARGYLSAAIRAFLAVLAAELGVALPRRLTGSVIRSAPPPRR